MPESQIKGLPAGAELRPISGLPPGAELRPVGQQGAPLNASTDPSGRTPSGDPAPGSIRNTFQRGMNMAGDVLQGVGMGAMNTLSPVLGGITYGVQKGSQMLGVPPNLLGQVPESMGAATSDIRKQATPTNMAQKVGHGGEQVAEFLIPGGAEEVGAAKLATMVPRLGRAAKPLARIAMAALSSGAVNTAQGGSPVTGAAMGAGGQVLGQGLKAMAPAIAEGALNIRKLDRAYGKGDGSIGRAILDETNGIRPGTIAQSAEDRLGELNPQLNAAADRASVQPNPARGLLTAPPEEIPLAAKTRAPKMRPMAFDAQVNPEEAWEPRSGDSMAPISDYPGANPHYLSGSAHPELSGRIPTAQGVLIRPAAATSGPIPSMIANPSASLGSARGTLTDAFGTAVRQGERTTAGQLQPMATHLGETMTGEPIPQNVTPRQLLDLKRGFGNEFIYRWNPETMTGVKGTAARTYHAMADEFNRTVPKAEGLNSRISNLIPVAKRASSEELNAPTVQRAVNRFAAHTGALTGAGIGGAVGYKEGGVPGAVAGGLIGVFAPELIASPEGQMATARLLNKASSLRPLVGTAAQFTRKRNDE